MARSRIERMTDEVRITSYWKIAVLTIVAAVVAVIVGVTSMTSGELTASEPEAAPDKGSDFVYFPSQYVNKATEPSGQEQTF